MNRFVYIAEKKLRLVDCRQGETLPLWYMEFGCIQAGAHSPGIRRPCFHNSAGRDFQRSAG
jgi:hypothetical protein